MNGYGGGFTGRLTASANTVITFLIPPSGLTNPGFTRVTTVVYANLDTLHSLTFMRPIGRTTVAAAAASGQATLTLTADPGLAASNNLAANDRVAIRETDGVTRAYVINNIAGGGASLNLTTNLIAGAAAGTKFWDFGIVGDTDPRTGAAHAGPLQAINTTTTYTDRESGVAMSHEADSPILVYSNNTGPGAGTIAFLGWLYSKN